MKKTAVVTIAVSILSGCFEKLVIDENSQSLIIDTIPVLPIILDAPDAFKRNLSPVTFEQDSDVADRNAINPAPSRQRHSSMASDKNKIIVNPPPHIVQPAKHSEAPIVVEIPTIYANAEQVISQQINAKNLSVQTLAYRLNEPVDWIKIDKKSGLISVNASEKHQGNHSFTAIVSNGYSETAQTFDVQVAVTNSPPKITDIPPISMISGETQTYTIDATDSDDDQLSYALTKTEPWHSIDKNSGTITLVSTEEHIGSHQLTVKVSDGKNVTLTPVNVVISEPPLKRALATGDHTLVSEDALLESLIAELENDAARSTHIIEKLYQGVDSLSWPLNQDTMHIGSYLSSDKNTKIISGNIDKNGASTNATLGIAGEYSNGGRYAYLTANPTAVHGDAGLDIFTKNLFNWLIGEEKTSLNIVVAQIPNRSYYKHYRDMVKWLNANYPDAYTINGFRDCDYDNLIPCIQSQNPDLIILSADDYERKGQTSLTEAYQYLKEHKIPTLMTSISRNASPMLKPYLINIGVHQTQSNYWSHYKTLDSTKDDVLTANAFQSNLIEKFQNKHFDIEPINTCTETLLHCTSDAFMTEFRKGADFFRSDVEGLDKQGNDVFALKGLNSIKLGLLLSDKFRSQIDYPITHNEPVEWYKALFADWVVSYARTNNIAQADLGEYIIDTALVLKGEYAHYHYPDVMSDTQVSHIPSPNQWTTTGWYALPGKPVTLTRTGEDSHTVSVRLHYARPLTNRVHSTKIFTKPIELTTTRLTIPPQGSVTFSTPYGAAIYLEHRDGTASPITATGIAKHPSITDFSDQQQIDDFEEQFNNSDIPHIDLKATSAELHLRRDRFSSAIGSIYPDTKALLNGIFHDHLKTVHSLAAFKVQGKTLEESIATTVMDLCIDKFGTTDCLNEALHTRTIIQHVNYDQYANCGTDCSGNPWDSSRSISPRNWEDNHELGHHLQTGRMNVSYASETNRNDWAKYSARADEASNNIFPYYVMWKGWHVTDGNTDAIHDKHMNGKDIFFAYQSEIDELTNENGDRMLYNADCSLLGIAKSRHKAIWSSSADAANNSYRMGFYIQMALRADAIMTEFSNGFDIYSAVYLHDRIFSQYITNKTLWNRHRKALGFGMFDFTTAHGTIDNIVSNDFLLVSLSHLTEYDWQPYFELYGLRNSDLAKKQAAANGTKGALDMGIFVHEEDLPGATVTGNLTFLPLGPTRAGTTWPRDNSTPADCGK